MNFEGLDGGSLSRAPSEPLGTAGGVDESALLALKAWHAAGSLPTAAEVTAPYSPYAPILNKFLILTAVKEMVSYSLYHFLNRRVPCHGDSMFAEDPRGRIWSEACDMLEQAERLLRQFYRPGLGPQFATWEPPIDMFYSGEQLWIIAALPSVAPERIEVSIGRDELMIGGSRPLPAMARGAAIHRLEIPYGRFERHIRLPPGPFTVEQSEFAGGCLVLSLIRKD